MPGGPGAVGAVARRARVRAAPGERGRPRRSSFKTTSTSPFLRARTQLSSPGRSSRRVLLTRSHGRCWPPRRCPRLAGRRAAGPATTALDLLNAVDGHLVRVIADAAYDTVALYETATARGATVITPPARTANVSGHGPRSPARDRTITLVKTLGRRRRKQASGYHRQGRVENTFFREVHHRSWSSRPEPSRAGE